MQMKRYNKVGFNISTNKIHLTALLILNFSLLCFNTHAATASELLGVWENNPKKGLRMEFSKDNTVTTWAIKGHYSKDPSKTKVTFISKEKMGVISNNKFYISEKHMIYKYKITKKSNDIILEFGPSHLKDLKFKFKKVNIEPIAYNKKQIFVMEIKEAINKGNNKKLGQLLSSDRANFLKTRISDGSQNNGQNKILQGIFNSAIDKGNIKTFKIVHKHIGIKTYRSYLSTAVNFKNEAMFDLLGNLSNIDVTPTAKLDSGLLDRLFAFPERQIQHSLVKNSRIIKQFGCDFVGPKEYNKIFRAPLTKAERVEIKRLKAEGKAAPIVPLLTYFERDVKNCLAKFHAGKPISMRTLNAKTIPGLSRFGHIHTALYYLANHKYHRTAGNEYKYYIMMKVLLELGADPKIKPTPESRSLADQMFIGANHREFRRVLNTKKHVLSNAGSNITLATIDTYNTVMKIIGGPPYDPAKSIVAISKKQQGNIQGRKAPHKTSRAITDPIPPVHEKKLKVKKSVKIQKLTNRSDTVIPLSKKKTKEALKIKGSYWKVRIVPVDPNMVIDPNIKALWGKGAYLYLRGDGAMGFNWNTPGFYGYDKNNSWVKKVNKLTIVMGDISYSFDLGHSGKPYTTVDNNTGVFKMMMQKKSAAQK